MVRHVSIRFAWHDDKWDGGVCKDPERNIYCTSNYSLLSPRIQRRIKLDIESRCRNQKISKVLADHSYLPPCYWCINALGNEECSIEEIHPFADSRRRDSKDFQKVPPIKYNLDKFSAFSWNFKIGYDRESPIDRYVHWQELQERTDNYLDEIEKGKSIAFFYANFSNPLTADNYKYLLLGAGLVKKTSKPKHYKVPQKLLDRVRSQPTMRNMPTLAWQFQLTLEPHSAFVLPYHEYLDLIEKEVKDDVVVELWKKLDDVTVAIEDATIIPNFKYVSMHISSDKCIYLLYKLRQSIRKMKEQKIVEYSHVDEIEEKIDNLLALAWKERGYYPGFRNVLSATLSSDFDKVYLKKLIPSIIKYIEQNFGSVEDYFENPPDKSSREKAPAKITNALRLVDRKKELVRFLSRFDFSVRQFENVRSIIDSFGLETLKKNPYLILENYQHDFHDSWDVDETDYGLSLYHIDIALIPDPMYVDWETLYDARSPERLRALVNKILYDTAMNEGNSCLTREEIIEDIQKYPLYYINEQLKVDVRILSEYEKQTLFKEKFLIVSQFPEKTVIYQLKTLRDIELIIEQFVDRMLRKEHDVDKKDVDEMVSEELQFFKGKELDVEERSRLYLNALAKGLLIVTGKAGSGKTHAVVNLINKFLRIGRIPVYVFTPTGKANLVIRNRLKALGLSKEMRKRRIYVSTIHRFLYRALLDVFVKYGIPRARGDIYRLQGLISELLDGKLELLSEFKSLAKSWTFNPKVLIIDEASMVDEVLLAVLFSLINPDSLEHLILVGDERQLPPIGIGRPFADLIFNLKRKDLEDNLMHLESNLRFDPSKRLGMLSELFSSEETPSHIEFEDVLVVPDDSLEVHYFSDESELKNAVKQILIQAGCKMKDEPLFDMFAEIFETDDVLNLEKVQVLAPRRVGNFGTMAINRNVVLDGIFSYSPKTKLICEQNIYFNSRGGRVLGLANGSIGYIKSEGYVYFDDIAELFADYPKEDVMRLVREIRGDVYNNLKSETRLDLGYAITVHKSQGSDFEHVIFIFSQPSPFITRELLYTALTRPKEKLHFVVHDDLKDELPHVLSKAHANSLVEQRKTLLFGHKKSPFKPYKLVLKDKTAIEVDSKIELIIAKALDNLGVKFEHNTKEFLAEHRVVPDFKLFLDNKVYYLEHLGGMGNLSYRERWFKKFAIYKKIGIADVLITTSEGEEKSDVEQNVKKIITDIKADKLKSTEGYSYHHYEI
jgi:exodeoxyribonuclease V alpha subunit